jgi:dTDP-4-amino-4,6-dideoxygalactose transaminase
MIGFNKPYLCGKEFKYIEEAIKLQKLSGNGYFTKKCHAFFENRYGFKKVLLTHSATAALEMAAILINIAPGDEVIMPSYTFVSTANAFLLRGAKIIFADSNQNNPNIDVDHVQSLITERTKAIVVVHYAGVACDMDLIMEIANRHGIYVIEDAAQAIESFYKTRPLGSIGHLAAFSFHETKNIIAGEGGMLVINDDKFIERSEIVWEKGTNRAAFSRREVNKYNWVDIGSSFLPSEITAAFLFAQLEHLELIQAARKRIWARYFEGLRKFAADNFALPHIDNFATNNAHLFYLVANNETERDIFLKTMTQNGIQAIFHYLPLHKSPYFSSIEDMRPSLPYAERYGSCLMRLPFYVELTIEQIDFVVNHVRVFYDSREPTFLSK